MIFDDVKIGQKFELGHWPNGTSVVWLKFSPYKSIAISENIALEYDTKSDRRDVEDKIFNICTNSDRSIFSVKEAAKLNTGYGRYHGTRLFLTTLRDLYLLEHKFDICPNYYVWAFDNSVNDYKFKKQHNVSYLKSDSNSFVWPTIYVKSTSEVEVIYNECGTPLTDFTGNLNDFLNLN